MHRNVLWGSIKEQPSGNLYSSFLLIYSISDDQSGVAGPGIITLSIDKVSVEFRHFSPREV